MTFIKWFNYKEAETTDYFDLLDEESQRELSKYSIDELDVTWFTFLVNQTPNGKILKSNTYKKDFQRLRFAHLTTAVDEIKKTGKIYASGGGLGVAVYCSPIHHDGTVSNIFEQYLLFQLPKHTSKNINAVIIEVDISKEKKITFEDWGVDYTILGEIQYETWCNLKKELPNKRVNELESKVFDQVKKIREILNKYERYTLHKITNKEFRSDYKKIFNKAHSLRFILFEVLAEFVLLFQQDAESINYASKKELNNFGHKKFINDLCPHMLKKFNMKEFYVDYQTLIDYFEKSSRFNLHSKKLFASFLKWRIGFYIKKVLQQPISYTAQSFSDLEVKSKSLLGHILYREYVDKNIFEEYRAEILLKSWELENIICPIYSILPKGEVGINPNLDKLGVPYSIFIAEFDKRSKKLINKERLYAKLTPKIISKEKAVVR